MIDAPADAPDLTPDEKRALVLPLSSCDRTWQLAGARDVLKTVIRLIPDDDARLFLEKNLGYHTDVLRDRGIRQLDGNGTAALVRTVTWLCGEMHPQYQKLLIQCMVAGLMEGIPESVTGKAPEVRTAVQSSPKAATDEVDDSGLTQFCQQCGARYSPDRPGISRFCSGNCQRRSHRARAKASGQSPRQYNGNTSRRSVSA